MNLGDLLRGVEYTHIAGDNNENSEISSFVYDSRNIVEGCLFICIRGNSFDGHSVVSGLPSKGVTAVLVEEDVELPEGHTMVLKVRDTRYAMAFVAANFYGNPARELTTIGVTGTKGKTTTTYMIKSILENMGKKVGLIGTIETIIGDKHIPARNTTPEAYDIQRLMREMADTGIDTVVMEVSSQGLMLHRTQGFIFDFGIFTNIEPDHISPTEHRDFDHYISCKSMLFKQCRIGIVNSDDVHLDRIIQDHDCRIIGYGIHSGDKVCDCDYYARDITLTRSKGELGVLFTIGGKLNMEVSISTPGKFSIYNALCAIALCHTIFRGERGDTGEEAAFREAMKSALKQTRVKGRIELVDVSDRFALMIDYAHNAMALESLLSTLREYNPHRLVCLFGCGGNRSRDRRFEMGEVSGRLADFTIITSDNPRYEKPLDIIGDIVVGIEKTNGVYVTIGDRREAIKYAITHGQTGDIIVLAGKGHEDYQEIEGRKYPMDERIIIKEIMDELKTNEIC